MVDGGRGRRYETKLVNYLRDRDYGVTKQTASGSAYQFPLPDLMVGTPGQTPRALEVKTTKGDGALYVDLDEARDLAKFSRYFDAHPMFAVRFISVGDTNWYFAHPSDVPRSSGESYKIHPSTFPLEHGVYEDPFGDDTHVQE